MSKCPHCGQSILHFILHEMKGTALNGRSVNCLAYLCPKCKNILGTTFDPLSLRNEITNELRKALKIK